MAEMIVSYVMSGGIGSRLWPLSREDNPKQFHDLAGDGSMLLRTVQRLRARTAGPAPVCLIASERHAGRIMADLSGIDLAGGTVWYEPMGRNTAAAVALATQATLAAHGDQLVLVVPSDHVISTDADFWASVEQGVPAAMEGRVVVFGVNPSTPETGYGYIEVAPREPDAAWRDILRFVEKPDLPTAKAYLAAGNYFWNAGIFLFRASAMKAAFAALQPEIWAGVEKAVAGVRSEVSGHFLPEADYAAIRSDSIDYAIMEKLSGLAMVEAGFRWNDLGSWQSLLDVSTADANGNVIIGDVVAIDCHRCYLRSRGRLLSVIGLKDVAVVATPDATFVAPVSESQNVKKVVEQLEKGGRLETRHTPSHDRVLDEGAFLPRVRHWLFEETLPLWSTVGVDHVNGGFHEALGFDGIARLKPKRMRTMARQVYAFAMAKAHGWSGPADDLIAHGLDFMVKYGRTARGGWVRALNVDGSVADPVEDTYDHAFVLLALAHAHQSGHHDAFALGEATFRFLDEHLEDANLRGFLETSDGEGLRRSNPHMHLLEAFLAWHRVTGDRSYLRRSARIVDLFRHSLFDPYSWTLGEYFDEDWKPSAGEKGQWTEPGHHFEWASLMAEFAKATGQGDLISYARKLYASGTANGMNRATGLAYGAVSREGIPLDRMSRSWPQTEVIKAAIALDRTGGPDMKPEIEARVSRLFRWHIDPAPKGLWIDLIDEKGQARATEVPASIFYHLVCGLTHYLDSAGGPKA